MQTKKKCLLFNINKSVSSEIIPIAHFQWDLSPPETINGQESQAANLRFSLHFSGWKSNLLSQRRFIISLQGLTHCKNTGKRTKKL